MAKKKQNAVEGNSDSLFSKALDMLNTQYGEGIVKSLTEVMEKPIIGTSTGSLSLDSIISPSAGGMQRGRIIEMYGPYSSGKTTLALGICANATANKEQVVYVEAEGSLNWESVLNAGVDKNYFHLIDDPDARKTANIVEGLMKSGEVGVAVIDSIATWRPLMEPKKGEDDVDFTKPKMAFQSSFLSDTLPYLSKTARQNDVVLVLINQVRNNLSGYGGGLIPFGGRAIEHIDSVRLKLSGKVSSTNDRIVDAEGEIVGQYTKCLVDKNKISMPMQEAIVPIFLGRGVNPYMELVTLSQKVGLVDGAAGRFKWAENGESIAYGINNFTQVLFDDRDLYMKLRKQVIEKLGLKYLEDRKVINAFHDSDCNKWPFLDRKNE